MATPVSPKTSGNNTPISVYRKKKDPSETPSKLNQLMMGHKRGESHISQKSNNSNNVFGPSISVKSPSSRGKNPEEQMKPAQQIGFNVNAPEQLKI